MDELERIEISAYRTVFGEAPRDVARELGLASVDVDGGIAVSTTAMPQSRLFNRVLGVEDAAPLAELESWYRSRGCTFAVTVVPGSPLEPLLQHRGYQRGRSATKFRRTVDDAPLARSAVDIRPIAASRASAFGELAAAVYGLSAEMGRWFASMHLARGWRCFGAYEDERLVGVAALHVADELGWLGMAATAPAARGRGAQSMLLSERIRVAAEAGARTLAVETPDPAEGQPPGTSHRNLLRAGFQPAYHQQLWLPAD